MKTKLTLEESARLIELGIDQKMASEREFVDKTEINSNQFLEIEEHPRFTLADIISILPKEIDDYYLKMSACANEWHSYYEKIELLGRRTILQTNFSPELIDTLYSLLIWYLEEIKED